MTYQNYEQPCQRSQNSEFQSHFSVSKIGRLFTNNVPNFFGSVHNSGKSDNDII